MKHTTDLTEIPTPLSSVQTHIKDLTTTTWKKKGITLVTDLLDHGKIIPFNIISQKYSLPISDHYTYLRIATFLRAYPLIPTKIPHGAWSFWNDTKHNTKGISLFYNLLQQKNLSLEFHHFKNGNLISLHPSQRSNGKRRLSIINATQGPRHTGKRLKNYSLDGITLPLLLQNVLETTPM